MSCSNKQVAKKARIDEVCADPVFKNGVDEKKVNSEGGEKKDEPTAAQRKSYDEDGFLHIQGFFDASECLLLQTYVKELSDAPEEPGGACMYFEKHVETQERILSRIEDFCRHHEGMSAMCKDEDSKLVHFLSALHNEDLLLFKDKINYKLPGGGAFKAHQDSAAGWEKYLPWFVSVGIFVDPSTKENGCLEVATGCHKKGLLGAVWEPIEHLDLPYSPVECQPGDIIIFDSYVPHRSADNHSAKQRRALFITLNKKKDGEKLTDYFADKRRDFPPDVERPKGVEFVYRV